MTSVEPGVVDANILVYALDVDAPQHAASLALLNAARDPATILFVTSQILAEFYSIVTRQAARGYPAFPRRGPSGTFGFACIPGCSCAAGPSPCGDWLGWKKRFPNWRF